ncbi:MAG: BspA family leucine-rich repeat surface protein [Prevotella sp.]|nr:BspA family leucine-rich repeat surface protein [Prevotella sp.]
MKPTSIIQRLVIVLITLISAIGANAQETYACYTSSNTTLTFYYDNNRSSRTGKTYDLNTNNNPEWDTDGTCTNVFKVVFHSSFANARPTSTHSWFRGMSSLQIIEGMKYLNTSEVTDMAQMFYHCQSLFTLDLSNFNTAKVNDMTWMFSGCTYLRTIYVHNGWSTAAVTQSTNMFVNSSCLEGGQGTTYSSSNPTDKTYAHIDEGPSNPGYFTKAPEAYACYTPSNTTLTFYYDNQRSSHWYYTTYDLNTGSNEPAWYTDDTYKSVTKVDFDPSFADARPTTTYKWFNNMKNLQSIEGICYLNTSEVTNMFGMFGVCNQLTLLDLSGFNTAKVTNMGAMFWKCSSLQTIYVDNGWSTAAVTGSSKMFTDCTKLKGGQGTQYNSSNVEKSYAHIDGGTSNPGYFSEKPNEAYTCYTPGNTTLTFYYDNKRNSRTGRTYVVNTGSDFPGWEQDRTNTNVTNVVFHSSFANARPTSTHAWFRGMENLQSFKGMNYLNTSEVTDMAQMFFDCACLTSLNLNDFNTSKVTDMEAMFMWNRELQTIYVGRGWNTDAVTKSDEMFFECNSLVGGQGTTYIYTNPQDKTYAHIDGGSSNPGYLTEWKEAYACYTSSNKTLTFYYDNLRSSREDKTYDLRMGEPGWETDGTRSYVTKVVFDSSFAVVRPTTTYHWFFGMLYLQSIEGMRYLNTSEVTDMEDMFTGCMALTSLDLSHFNTSKVTQMGAMFYGCTKLQTIYVGDGWSTTRVSSSTSMFYQCTSLKGGKGTTYDASHVDKTYARIDGEGGKGYFTEPTTGIATGLNQVPSDKSQVQSYEWYTIDGRKLNEVPAKKGIYIQNGRAVLKN